jgi:ribonuclease HII
MEDFLTQEMKQIYKKTSQLSKHSKSSKLHKPCIIGVDEAGRGAWAGPVVAACVLWSGRNPFKGLLNDSKKMNAKSRQVAYEEILQLEKIGRLTYGVGIMSNAVIDRVGIREANRLAMSEALAQVQNAKGKIQNGGISLKIDGRDNYAFDIPVLPEPEYIVRGDSKIKQIMAASILAKVTRDRIMADYENTFPGYGFERHRGYGTAIHQQALWELGICEIHRKSYQPIKNR